ncbi:tetratricopeptide repeat protein [Polyangium jinanense]|uniref:Tetratricopeptide repeat protein n=1 Tax=Polyangium jinanense TaxID=2829994 RepID=A0A9X4AWT7_9BACT|nr:tetratricopeptide repeat protein [Polyangium jinanense]MDC3959244.1 hypothetical protein [Polyangium jinanense]MDC3987664.1 hypothetical protein [Polyangium jinanense]
MWQDAHVGKKPWTAERRWESLVKKGIVDPDTQPGDLDALAGKVSAALSPTIYDDSVRSADTRTLFEAFVDELHAQVERKVNLSALAWRLEAIASALEGMVEIKDPLRFLETAVLAAPTSVALQVRLANSLLGERRYVDAEETLARALALDPTNQDALSLLDICKRDPQRPR